MRQRALPESVKYDALRAATRQVGSWDYVVMVYSRWTEFTRLPPCKYGKEQLLAIDCNCDGCRATRLYNYFDQVARRFAMAIR